MNLLGDRYHVVSELGRGGCGVTYLAEDTHMPSRRRCVVKLLEPTTKDPSAIAIIRSRFEREAAVLESLSGISDQIPILYAYLSQDREFYLVQQYVEGPTLRQWIDTRGPLGELEVRALLDGMLAVLAIVHERHVIHRDVKPENIILRATDGRPILIDFGAVKESVTTDVDAHGGSTSVAIGTPGYMPLEQAAGRPVYASDLYSLGATAIVALTGRRLAELVDRATGDVVWRAYAPGTSAGLADVLDRATAVHARDRFRSAEEMRAALHGATAPAARSERSAETVPRVDVRPTPGSDTEIVPRRTADPVPLASLGPSAIRPAAATARITSGLLFAAAATVEPVFTALRGAPLHKTPLTFWSLQLALLGVCAILLGNRRRHGAIAAIVGAAGAASGALGALAGVRPAAWTLPVFVLFGGAALLAVVCGVLAGHVPKRVAGAAVARYLLLGMFWATADLLFVSAAGRLNRVELFVFALVIAGCALACAGGAIATAALVAVSGICLATLALFTFGPDTDDVVPYAIALQAVALAASPFAVWGSLRRSPSPPERPSVA